MSATDLDDAIAKLPAAERAAIDAKLDALKADYERKPGWHWLRRRRDGALRAAFRDPMNGWRVSDATSRTVLMSPLKALRLYDYVELIEPPR